MRTRRLVALVLMSAVGAVEGCGGGQTASAYSPLTERLIAAVNNQYNEAGPSQPPVSFSISSASVPSDQAAAARAAARAVIRACNEGRGTRIVAVGLVNGTATKRPIFAVFMNPPGNHIAPSARGPVLGPPLNWYAAFVTSLSQLFCTFGHSPNLSTLPVH